MRLIIYTFVLLLCAAHLSAQIRPGITVGAAFSSARTGSDPSVASITGGLACDIAADPKLDIRTELLYTHRGMLYTTYFTRYDDPGWDEGPEFLQTDIVLHYISLPVSARFLAVQSESFTMALTIGLYGAVVVGASAYTPLDHSFPIEPGGTSVEWGTVLGVGTSFAIAGSRVGFDCCYWRAAQPAMREVRYRSVYDGTEYTESAPNDKSISSVALTASFFF